MKRHLALALICFVLGFTLIIASHWELYNSDTLIVKKEVVKHEQHKNVLHDDGKTTEVFSHTIRYGDTMTVEIDTFIYR
jgi:hypothetical protein